MQHAPEEISLRVRVKAIVIEVEALRHIRVRFIARLTDHLIFRDRYRVITWVNWRLFHKVDLEFFGNSFGFDVINRLEQARNNLIVKHFVELIHHLQDTFEALSGARDNFLNL